MLAGFEAGGDLKRLEKNKEKNLTTAGADLQAESKTLCIACSLSP
jgi:hypothetical protein